MKHCRSCLICYFHFGEWSFNYFEQLSPKGEIVIGEYLPRQSRGLFKDYSITEQTWKQKRNLFFFFFAFTYAILLPLFTPTSINLVHTLSLSSASLCLWEKDPACGWSRDHLWQKLFHRGRVNDQLFFFKSRRTIASRHINPQISAYSFEIL